MIQLLIARLSILIAIGAGLLALAGFFVVTPGIDAADATLANWVTILLAAALLLGLQNVAQAHLGRVARRAEGWGYSLVLLVAASAVIFVGLWPSSAGPDGPAVAWAYRYVLSPLNATVFSLLAFFMASAAYRALRLRSRQSFVVLAAALTVLLGQVPIGYQIWPDLPLLKDWLMEVPVTGAFRGVLIGIGLGTVAAGLRVLMAQDRPYAEGVRR